MPRIAYAMVAVVIAMAMTVAACGGAEPATPDGNGLGLSDGTYEGNSDANRQGYVWVEVTVSDGEITEVAMKEFRGDGTEKTPENYTYEEWIQAAEELPQAVVEAQSADVDAVAGATGTSDKFTQAVRRALDEETAYDMGPYEDGTYVGVSDETERGDWVEVEVNVLLGTIVSVSMEEYRADGEAKSPETYDYAEWAVAAEELPQAVVEAQSADVDAVAGATGTSNLFIQAMERALEDAS